MASESAVCAGEFIADYLLVQRAIAQDVWTASRRRARGESTASMLDRMDGGGRLHYHQMLSYVVQPAAILAEMMGEEDEMDAEYRQKIDAYLLTRSLPEAGVLEPFI